MNKSITVLVDNDSWVIPYARRLVEISREMGFDAEFVQHPDQIRIGWVNFIIGCTRILSSELLQRNRYNLVVHESDLPKGRGFAPITWQILEGKRRIPVCLMEAAEPVDSGNIWIRDFIDLDGSELCEEWRALQGEKTIELCTRFLREHHRISPIKQVGVPSFYPARRSVDSMLDVNKSILDQFNLLRVVDNERYPAFFEVGGQTYQIKIFKVGRGK